MEGWIKLYRKIQTSPLYRSLNSKHRDVMIQILLMANHTENEWAFKGEIYNVRAGQFVTSLENIKEKCATDVSIQNIRTCLLKLEKGGFLTNKSTNKNRLITVVNWDIYQCFEENQQADQQSSNKQLTTNKNDKEIKKLKTSSSRQGKTFDEESPPYRLAVYLHGRIMAYAEELGKGHLVRGADLQKWADECRKILEIDNRDKTELKAVIDWATSDPFWQQNILSPKKLREKYIDLALKMGSPQKPSSASDPNERHSERNKREAQKILEAMERERIGNQAALL